VTDSPLDIDKDLPSISLIPAPIEILGRCPELYDKLPDRSSGSTSPRFSR